FGPVRGDENEILEPGAAVALAVAARLDGDDVAGPQRQLRGEAHPGLLVHLEPHTVAQAVEEAVVERLPVLLGPLRRLTGPLEDLARGVENRAAVRAVPDLGDRPVEGLLRQCVPASPVLRDVPD